MKKNFKINLYSKNNFSFINDILYYIYNGKINIK